MQPVPPERLEIVERREVAAQLGDVLAVAAYVHRIRLRHAHLDAVDDISRIDEPDAAHLVGRQGNGVLVRQLPEVVALEAEIFDAEARLPGRTISGLHAPKFCTRPARMPGS